MLDLVMRLVTAWKCWARVVGTILESGFWEWMVSRWLWSSVEHLLKGGTDSPSWKGALCS